MYKYLLVFLIFQSCSTDPQPILAGKDHCFQCKMGVVDARFGSEIITGKGKIYKFDDIICMIDFMKSESISEKDIRQLLVVDYIQNESFINAREAVFLWSRELHSPMNGNSAAFTSREKAEIVRKEKGGEIRDWNDLYKELN